MTPSLIKPQPNLASLVLRLGIAAIFIVQGYLKATLSFTLVPEVMNLASQRAVGWTELVCGVLVLVGLFSRLAALVIVVLQAGAIYLVSWKEALVLVWFPAGDSRAESFQKVGPEYNMVLISMCVALLVLGSGAYSLDRFFGWLVGWGKAQDAPATTGPAPAAPVPAAGATAGRA
jgi:uncharacterized membrane protein YphA (DoxX/SURF4 family)